MLYQQKPCVFSQIVEIRSIRDQKARLSERERELTKPMLTDLDMIPTLYDWFKEIVSQQEPFRANVSQRKKFLFVILILYSPCALAGGKMKNGLRNKLAEVFGLNEKSTISNNLNGLYLSYQLYKYFRQDIHRIYTEIMNRLGNIHSVTNIHDNDSVVVNICNDIFPG